MTPSPAKLILLPSQSQGGLPRRSQGPAAPALETPPRTPRGQRPSSVAGSPEYQNLSRRLEQAELRLASQALEQSQGSGRVNQQFADAMDKQAELLANVWTRKAHQSSTVRVEPRIQWPKLGDDGPGGADFAGGGFGDGEPGGDNGFGFGVVGVGGSIGG